MITVLVALDFGNHLLQTPDGLLASFLWHLVLEVVGGAVLVLVGLILLVIGNVLVGAVLEGVQGGAATLLGVNARVSSTLLIFGSETSSSLWVTLARWVSSGGGVTCSIL